MNNNRPLISANLPNNFSFLVDVLDQIVTTDLLCVVPGRVHHRYPTRSAVYASVYYTPKHGPHVPIESFPPCDKRWPPRTLAKEDTTRTLGKELCEGQRVKTIHDCRSNIDSTTVSTHTPFSLFPPESESHKTQRQNGGRIRETFETGIFQMEKGRRKLGIILGWA